MGCWGRGEEGRRELRGGSMRMRRFRRRRSAAASSGVAKERKRRERKGGRGAWWQGFRWVFRWKKKGLERAIFREKDQRFLGFQDFKMKT